MKKRTKVKKRIKKIRIRKIGSKTKGNRLNSQLDKHVVPPKDYKELDSIIL